MDSIRGKPFVSVTSNGVLLQKPNRAIRDMLPMLFRYADFFPESAEIRAVLAFTPQFQDPSESDIRLL
jgi:hypothetical protein